MPERDPARPAAIMSDSGRTLSYAALEDGSLRLAQLFRAEGLVDGDRIAILMENTLEWFVAAWGARRAGLFFVPVNWHLKPVEIAYVMANSDARAVVTSARLLDLAVAAIGDLPGVDVRLSVGGGDAGGFRDFADAVAAYPPVAFPFERDGGAMPYSSGTTGHPKGIMRALTDDRFGTANGLETLLSQLYGIDAATIYLSPAPLYHSSPVGFTGTVLTMGGTIILQPSFDAEGALAAIERFRVTHAQFVPTHFVRMLRLPATVRRAYDLASLRIVIHAAAPCAPDVKRAMIEWLGPIVFEYYAGSERCGFTAIDSADWLAHPGSVGRSLTGAVHIIDLDTGRELPAGEIGLVYFEDPVEFAYHKDPGKTAQTFNDRGWGTHGDVGHVDTDGYLYLADRRSDLILSGGVNIYPQEIENALAAHPAVADVGVIGLPDAEFGQTVCAVVQCVAGAKVSEEALIAHARDHVAHFKAPRRIVFVDALPRLPNGKLLRREITAIVPDKEPA